MFVLLAFAAASGTGGIFETGNSLYTACTDSGYVYSSSCNGYIQGVVDLQTQQANAGEAQLACVPDTVTAGQLKDVVTAYLRDHAAIRHYGGAGLVLSAMREAFPCAK
jgi:hypothetical protein